MKTKLSLALLGWLALVTSVFGQEKEYLQKAPRGIRQISEKISQEFPVPEGFLAPSSAYKNLYNRQGNLLQEQSLWALEFHVINRFEYDYDAHDRILKLKAFNGDDSPNFVLEFSYNGDGSGTRDLKYQDQDGEPLDYDPETWDFDNLGRLTKGYRWYSTYFERVTFCYHSLGGDSRGHWGDGLLSEIKEEHCHYTPANDCYSTISTEFFYDKDNKLETVRHSNGDYMDWIQSYNDHGDLLEWRDYNKAGEFIGRQYYKNKYATINGLEVKTEVVIASYWDYEHTDGTKEEPHSVVKYVYEYQFWEEDWNEHRTKPEEKK